MSTLEFWMLSYLVNSLWQVPLLFATGWVAARLLRPVGAAMEHIAWVTVLLLQVLVPACSTLSPGWAAALFSMLGGMPAHTASSVSVVMGPGSAAGTFHLSALWLSVVAIAYAGLTAYFAARFLRRWANVHALSKEAAPISLSGFPIADWAQYVEPYALRNFSICTSQRLYGPVSLGLRKPLVLIPEDMLTRLSADDLKAVLSHEFAHLARHDFLKNLIYELLSLPLSYHPLFWLTREHITDTREMICDQMAAATSGKNQYAQSLLRLASLLVKGMRVRTPHAIGIFDTTAFERRIMRLTGKQKNVNGIRRFALVAASAALGIATCASALAMSLHIDADSAKPTETASKTPDRVDVSASVMAGNILHKVTPVYPVDAKKAGTQGKVVLDAIIGKDGTVENLKVDSGPKDLQKSALDAVRQWTYKPFLLNGKPVEVKTTVNVTYSLAK